MKILQIICTLGTGGAEKLLLDTVVLYRKAGIEMDVLVLWDNDFPFTRALKELDCCNIYILKKSKNYNDIYNPSAILKIKKIIKNYDIAHVHLFPPQYFTVIANILNGSKTKLIFTEHSTLNRRIANKIYKPIEKFFYDRYDKVICITEEIEKKYQRYLGLSDKWLVINNGIDLDKIDKTKSYKKSDLGYAEEDNLLIMVAGFRIGKDQDTVIKSLLQLPQSYKLILVGDGVRRLELENLVAKLNLADRVNFLGVRSDVYALYKMCDVAVLSSQWEGFGLAAAESMACGIPTIASNVEGLSQVVDGAGILFENGDVKQLVEIILSLQEDKEKSKSVAAKGLVRAKRYDIATMVANHIQLYQSVLEKSEREK